MPPQESRRFEQGLAQVRSDRTRGAAELARAGLRLLVDSALSLEASTTADWRRQLLERAQRLAQCRPSMAALRHLVEAWQATGIVTADDALLHEGRRIAMVAGEALIEQSQRATAQAADHLARHLGAGRILMTHSLSSTILAVFTRLAPRGVTAIVTESRPLQEGFRLAERLSALGVPTTLITDAQMGRFVARADAVIVGADSRCPDGSLINKAGTYLLALAARDQGVPFYVCSERFKQRQADWGDPEFEQMDPGEIEAPILAGVTVENGYFDRTPSHLISQWFDEQGGKRHFLSTQSLTEGAMTLMLKSSAFHDGGAMPAHYTCEGQDVSPPLTWTGVPNATRSLALIVDDPDAPDPQAPKMTWVHWVLYNLPPEAAGLAQGVASAQLPPGAQEGVNDWRRTGYGGPCPPIGRHRYFHKLYALDTRLEGLNKPTKAQLEAAMQGHILAQAVLVGTYQKGQG